MDPTIKIEDAALVARTQAGDVEAFRVLFERYQRRIYGAVYGVVGSQADAEDVTQDAFVRAYRALSSLREGEAFLPWVYRIALNLARNHLRDRRPSRWESLDERVAWGDDECERQVPDPAPGPASLAEEHEVQAVVRAAIRDLPPHHREVILLHHLEGLPLETIAGIAGCSVGTVKSRLSRGREALKRKLRGYVLAES